MSVDLSRAQVIAQLPEKERRKFYAALSDDEVRLLQWEWRHFWARPKQLMPALGGWDTWFVMSGRGFGKTRSGAEAIRELVMVHGYRRIGLIARTAADVRDVMVEGESGLLSVFPPWFRPRYQPSIRRVTFPNGAIATTYSGDNPDQLRGPQHDALWCDELAAWRYEDSWDQAQFGLRLGLQPVTIVTTTPRPTALIRKLADPALAAPVPMPGKRVVLTVGSTYENSQNLAPSALQKFRDKYEGTRLGRQELAAELLMDTPGALWRLALIEHSRRRSHPALVRIVVAIDPPGSHGTEAAEAGIVVAGLGADGHGYVLDDVSINGTPAEWARAAINAYHQYEADRMIGEVNNGGDMVEYTVQATVESHEDRVAFKQVRASRGKAARAEPVSALYEQGRVHHVGAFPELEDQMTTWVPGDKSPDRLDALVWAMTELMVAEEEEGPAIVRVKGWW